jgi:hypothetical protein
MQQMLSSRFETCRCQPEAIVTKNREQYCSAKSHREKREIVDNILKELGGRFLRANKAEDGWTEVSRDVACVKISQAIQYRRRRVDQKKIRPAETKVIAEAGKVPPHSLNDVQSSPMRRRVSSGQQHHDRLADRNWPLQNSHNSDARSNVFVSNEEIRWALGVPPSPVRQPTRTREEKFDEQVDTMIGMAYGDQQFRRAMMRQLPIDNAAAGLPSHIPTGFDSSASASVPPMTLQHSSYMDVMQPAEWRQLGSASSLSEPYFSAVPFNTAPHISSLETDRFTSDERVFPSWWQPDNNSRVPDTNQLDLPGASYSVLTANPDPGQCVRNDVGHYPAATLAASFPDNMTSILTDQQYDSTGQSEDVSQPLSFFMHDAAGQIQR